MESRSGEDDLLGNSVTVKRILERVENGLHHRLSKFKVGPNGLLFT